MKFRILDLLLFVTMLAAVIGGLVFARRQAIAVYGDQAAQSQWDAWRTDAKKLSEGPGPVIRRTPKSVRPPALVLMQDYFPVCLALSVLLSSVLFATTLAFFRGALSSAPFVDRSLPEEKNQKPSSPR
ncbi:hypothetical protein [Anatilimnocola floriformis]|uniref:hypothetical protein n=1 Tax=Anatilimnocola floriformis TaxID=2948575 RepID=UPI0020C5AD24|nr:hypothetical protein [Anatilimnocola floriformis]